MRLAASRGRDARRDAPLQFARALVMIASLVSSHLSGALWPSHEWLKKQPMNSADTLQVRLAAWEADSPEIRAVRNTVFSDEQGISETLDFDGRDRECVHLLAYLADGENIGTARMLPDGHVGRIAVHRQWRGKGVGTRLVEYLSEVARERGFTEILLHSQVQAAAFYSRLGFEARGDTFMEAGIEHVSMVRTL